MSQEFKQEHMMKLQGKDYLPVAPRVLMFRKEHPTASISTAVKSIGDDTYVYAEISEADTLLATAHKKVKKNGKGPAALWPLETAETGAIGRALALCGYGTLAGELDEGDQLADAPVETTTPAKEPSQPALKPSEGIGTSPATDVLGEALDLVKTAKTLEELAELKPKLRGMADGLRDAGDKEGRKKLVAAVKAHEKELQPKAE